VAKQRNRWIILAVLTVATLSFVGVSVILPFTNAFKSSQVASSPSPSASASPRSDLEEQAKGYELVLQREPENQSALRGLVDTRIQQGKIKEIIPPLEKLAKLNPAQPDYAVLLAQAKQQAGDREGAAQAYRDTLAAQPGNMRALEGLTGLLLQQQRAEAAASLLQDTLNSADATNKAKPGSVDVSGVKLLLARVYADQQRFDEAIALYDQVIQTNKEDFRPVVAKALVLQAQGKTEEAKTLFTSAAALAPPQFKDQINQLAAGKSPSPAASSSPSPAPGAAPSPVPNPAAAAPSAAPSPAAAPSTAPESAPAAESPAASPAPAASPTAP
jgi:tetratricopeptide (TPR) repeat protein